MEASLGIEREQKIINKFYFSFIFNFKTQNPYFT